MSEWPQFLGLQNEGLESRPYSGHWSVVKAPDGSVMYQFEFFYC